MADPTKADLARGKKCRDCGDTGCGVHAGTSLVYGPDTDADPGCFVPPVPTTPQGTYSAGYAAGHQRCKADCIEKIHQTWPTTDPERSVEDDADYGPFLCAAHVYEAIRSLSAPETDTADHDASEGVPLFDALRWGIMGYFVKRNDDGQRWNILRLWKQVDVMDSPHPFVLQVNPMRLRATVGSLAEAEAWIQNRVMEKQKAAPSPETDVKASKPGECHCDAPECLYLNGNGQCNAPCLGPTAPETDEGEVEAGAQAAYAVYYGTRLWAEACNETRAMWKDITRAVLAARKGG